jgi:hypothetical protein
MVMPCHFMSYNSEADGELLRVPNQFSGHGFYPHTPISSATIMLNTQSPKPMLLPPSSLTEVNFS